MIKLYKKYFQNFSELDKLYADAQRLHEFSIIIVPMLIGPISTVWALIYLYFEAYNAAIVPFIYTLVSLFNLWHYEKTNNLLIVKKTQMILVLILPFILMWTLGGFANSSYIMVWAFFAPIAAIVHETKGEAKYWLLAFLFLMGISVLVDPWLIEHTEYTMPRSTQELFYFLNISASLTGIYYLLKFFVYNKDKGFTKQLKEKNQELLESNKKLQTMLYTDPLTQLKNRRALIEEKCKSQGISLALLNIDRFSQVNDLYGENFGDKVLIHFSTLLKNCLSHFQGYDLYRLGSDEFVIISKNSNAKELSHNISRIADKISQTAIEIDDQEILLNITAGISNEIKQQLLPTANMALKAARREGVNIEIYSNSLSLNDEYENNIYWIKEIKEAIKEDRIVLYYQPIVDNKNSEVKKFETLIRLIDKKGNIVTPYYFLEIAKKSKLYKELTKIVIKKSFETFKKNDYEFSINLTIDDILDHNITEMIFEMLQEYKLSDRLIFEIVESESIENFKAVGEFIKQVKSYGCRIAIDDFGTGYSNFEHLMRLQADFIKIDGSIIKEITHNKRSELITSVIVAFAKGMHIETIGEYVESETIHNKLIELGVNKSQGYYFGEAKPNLP